MIWIRMRRRCNEPTDHNYATYGGRGIYVCEAWRRDFAAFLADMGERPTGLTLDRIDNDGPYAPGNCRWTDMRTQQRNRSNNKLNLAAAIEIARLKGKRRPTYIAADFGVSTALVRKIWRGDTWPEAMLEASRPSPGEISR